MGTTGPARQDELHAIETELAGHATFGDARRILDRHRAFALLRMEAAFRNRPPVRALCKELRDGRHRRAAADVLADPVVLAGVEGLPEAPRRGDEPRAAEFEELCATVQRRLRDGASGLPTASGCLLNIHPRGTSSAITLWDPDAPASIFKRRFKSTFHANVTSASLRLPEPAFANAVERGCDLLARVLPELAASALAHLRLIGVISSEKTRSCVCHHIAATAFVRPTPSRTPWEMAEVLLHEALHCKLGDLARSRAVFRWEGDGSKTIRPVWRRSQPGADWPLRRAFSAFHVYVHLALFFARVEHTGDAGAFGAIPASFRRGCRTALERADHLRRSLSANARPVGSDCRSMFAWLSQMLQRLSAAA